METYIDPYYRLLARADEHETLYHYTSMSSFENIISGGKLKLNRLDQMDDKGENEFLSDFWKNKVYACCFTHSKKGKPRFWSEYAKNDGVRIEFPNCLLVPENYRVISQSGYVFPQITRTNIYHKTYDCDSDWGVYDISKLDVQYIKPGDGDAWRGNSNGLLKNCLDEVSYDWEEETRIRIAMRPIGWEEILDKTNRFVPITPFFDAIFIKLGINLLRNISVSIRRNEDVQKVRRILSMNPATKDCKISL